MKKILLFTGALLFAALSMWAQTTRYVPESAGTPGYATIQAAIDAAAPNDIIEVAAGTYYENYSATAALLVTKSITITGTGLPVVDGGGTHDRVIEIHSDNVSIIGMKFTNSSSMGMLLYGVGSGYTCDNALIQNCEITNNDIGIQLNEASNAVIENNTITGSTFRGIIIQQDSYNNAVKGNTITMTGGDVMNAIYIGSNSGGNTIGGSNVSDGNTINVPSNTTIAAHMPYAIYLTTGGAYDATIQNNIFTNIGARGVQIDGGNTGTYTISDNSFTSDLSNSINMHYAIGVNAGNIVATDNTMVDTQRPFECFGAGTVTFTGNTLSGANFFGVNLGSYTGDPTVTGNAFLGFGGNGNVVWNQGAGAVDASGNWWGDLDPSDNQNNSGAGSLDYTPWWGANYVGDDHATAWTWYTNDGIQDAIVAATGGDVIEVAAGIYNENVTIDRAIDLLGDDRTTTTIDGGGSGVVVTIVADAVSISGFTVQGSGPDPNSGHAGIGISQVDNCDISDNYLSGNAVGVAMAAASSNTISNNTFTGNAIGIGSDNDAAIPGGAVTNGSTLNTISNNIITLSGVFGMYIAENCHNNTIFDNTVTSSGETGLYLWKSSDNEIYNNGISNNTVDGIHLLGSYDNTIYNNTITSNASGFEIRSGTIASTGNSIYNNEISSNTNYGIKADENAGNLVDATCNWWGTTVGSVIAASIVGNVDYSTVLLTPELNPADPNYDCGTAWPSPVHNVTQDTYYSTIQAAIDAVSTVNGDVIEVDAGTFVEDVTVNKSVTIFGQGSGITEVQPTLSANAAFTVSVDNVTIHDLEITHPTILTYGISLNGATTSFTLQDVDITNIGGASATANGHGIYIYNSFSGLTVEDCIFSSGYQGTTSRGIGVFAPNNLTLSNFDISGSTFEYFFVGVYLRSAIDGLDVNTSTFGPFELTDCTAAVAGIYIGDGNDDNFDIENITVTGNTFTEYGRGVYVWNYGANSTINDFDISGNTFTNSIWSSGIRFILGLNGMEDYSIGGTNGITIDNNDFTQNSDIGGNVALIDLKTYDATLLACDVSVTDNDISFTGGPYVDAMYGIQFFVGGDAFYNTTVSGNVVNGGSTGGAALKVPSTGIAIIHYANDPTVTWTHDLSLNITNNQIIGFDHGVSIYDNVNSSFGGLPTGTDLNINNNDLSGNALYGIAYGTGETVTATCNWWGTTVLTGIAAEVDGQVSWSPFLISDNLTTPDCSGYAPVENLTTEVPYLAIMDAVDEASAGDKIGMRQGVYTENVTTDGRGGIVFAPGNSPGCVDITGNFTLTDPGDAFDMEIYGTTVCSEYDQINVSGTLTWDVATLNLIMGSYNAPTGTAFTLFTYGTLVGTPPAYVYSGAQQFEVDATGGSIVLTALDDKSIDIAIHEIGCAEFEVVLIPDFTPGDNSISNVQFTIQYPASVSLTNLNPEYGLILGSTLTPTVDYKYITYVGLDLPNSGWVAGTEYVVLTFNHDQSVAHAATPVTGDFVILPDADATVSTKFYAEWFGSDVTGDIDAGATGSWLSGCPVWNVTQDLYYYNIQDPISDVANIQANDNIKVLIAGTYTENVTVDVAGITLEADATSVPGNVIIDGDATGNVVTVSANDVTLQGFTLQNSGTTGTDAGVSVSTVDGCAVVGNTITGNTNGVLLSTVTNYTVENNVISSNDIGVSVSGGSTASFTHNNLSGNTTWGVSATATPDVDASCNWWGSANINVIAAEVDGDVDFTSYLNSSTETSPSGFPYGFDPIDGTCASPLSLKVFLQGPYDATTDLMTTGLNSNGQLPTAQPFNQAPWNYAGIETLPDPLPTDIVDWVLVELRSDINTSLEMAAGLLYADGSVVANLTADQSTPYYIVVYQRNHMPVMSATAIVRGSLTGPYDFSTLTNLYGNANTPGTPAWELETDVWGMIAGDVTANGLLQYSGPGNDRGPILAEIIAGGGTGLLSTISDIYWFEDVNMDNEAMYSGGDNDRAFIINNLNTLTGNAFVNSIYTSLVPGAYTGTKDAGINDGPINIEMQNGQIVLTPNENISNGLMDNIQFTLAWKSGDQDAGRAVENFASDCGLLPQGEPIEINGESHQVFVSIDFTELPKEWTEGQPITIMSLDKLSSTDVWIADNDFTENNNAMYYVSLWGEDLTGEIKKGVSGIGSNFDLSVYPNPVSDGSLNVIIPSDLSGITHIKVYDMQGGLRFETTQNADAGKVILNVSNLKAGVYMIMLTGENELHQARFIIGR